jgi:hypothetical protein
MAALMMGILPRMHKGGRTGIRDTINAPKGSEIGSKALKEHH